MLFAADDAVVIINGLPYTGLVSIRVEQSFDKASGQGTITITPQPGRPFPVKLGARAQVLLGSAHRPAITGHVHEVNGEHGLNQHTIQLTLFDKTKDAVDSTIGPGNTFKPPVKLKQVMDKTLKNMGLSDIQVIDEASPDEYTSAEVPVGAIDDTGIGWFDQWAKRRQVVLGTDGKGNFKIQRNQRKRGSGMLFKSFEDNPLNNIIRARYKNSDQDRFNKTNVAGQHSQNDLDYWEGRDKGDPKAQPDKHANRYGIATDTGVRPERQKHVRGQKGLYGGSPSKSAKWRSNLARSRGFQYVATVQGFEMSPGELWWPGLIVPVRDDHFQISDDLFIVSVRFTKTLGGGSGAGEGGAITEVTLTHSDAYSESEAGPNASRTSKRGAGTAETGEYEEGDTSDLDTDDNDPGTE